MKGRDSEASLIRVPLLVVLAVLAACLFPLLLVGPDPIVRAPRLPWLQWDLPPAELEEYFLFFGGAFLHSALLLIAGTLAGCAALLSLARARAKASMLTTVLTIVLFWSATIFLVQGISTEGAGYFAADRESFVPFTWLITRSFLAVLLLFGGLALLIPNPRKVWTRPLVSMLTFGLVGITSLAVVWLASTIELPQTVFPDRIVKRPLDIPILVVLLLCAALIYPRVYQRYQTTFAGALWLSLIPFIAAEIYLIFGSRYPFDDVFNSAYGLITLAYLIIFVGLVWDYTRVMKEEQQIREEMIKVDRMVTIGSVTAGVGHEIKNPLTYTSTNLEWSLERLEEFEIEEMEEIREALGAALTGTEKIKTIVDDIKVLSRFQPAPIKPIQLAHAVEVALRMTTTQIDRRVWVEEKISSDVYANADEGRLTQVVMNLLVNASQALEETEKEGGKIRVSVYQEGSEAVIEVADSGPGIRKNQSEQIFTPFYTTKEAGVGTGLGLSLSRQIIEDFGGTISLVPAQEEGACFQVRLQGVEKSRPLSRKSFGES